MPSQPSIPLDSLRPRECGIVAGVDAPDADLERLMAMGVCAGRSVELVQRGDPLIIRVYGTRVGVSARLAGRIHVSVCRDGTCGFDLSENGRQ